VSPATTTGLRAWHILWRNLAAMIYDTLLVLPLFMATTMLWVTVYGPRSAEQATVPNDLQWFSWLLILLGFFGLFWRKNGQTLGMQAWRIQLVNSSGSTQISWYQCLRRIVVALISATCLGAGYWWCLIDRSGRTWHDHASQTRLVLLPKKATQ